MNLHDINVLITRPGSQSGSLAQRVSAAGGRAVIYPLLTIVPLNTPAALGYIEKQVRGLDELHMLIFVSTNAAREALPWLKKYWPELPPDLVLLAVGPASAAELKSLGVPVQTAAGGVGSEDLLALETLQRVQGKRIAIVRGRGGRELLADTLRQRGAHVEYIELYERREPETPAEPLSQLLKRERINAITVTSSQILETLIRRLGGSGDGNIAEAGLIPLLVPSARVAQQAVAAGFTRVIDVAGADDETLLSGLIALARNRLAD